MLRQKKKKKCSRNLKASKELSDQSQQDMKRFINSMSEYALKVVSEIYADDLLTMESKGFKEINKALSYTLPDLAVTIDNAVFNNQIKTREQQYFGSDDLGEHKPGRKVMPNSTICETSTRLLQIHY